jgi:hypothetical protein
MLTAATTLVKKGKRSAAAVTTESCTANVAVEAFNQQAFGTTVFILAIDAMDHWKFDSLRIVKKWQPRCEQIGVRFAEAFRARFSRTLYSRKAMF